MGSWEGVACVWETAEYRLNKWSVEIHNSHKASFTKASLIVLKENEIIHSLEIHPKFNKAADPCSTAVFLGAP